MSDVSQFLHGGGMRDSGDRLAVLGGGLALTGALLLMVLEIAGGPVVSSGTELTTIAVTISGLGGSVAALMFLARKNDEATLHGVTLGLATSVLGLASLAHLLALTTFGPSGLLTVLAHGLWILAVTGLAMGLWRPTRGTPATRGENAALGLTGFVSLVGCLAASTLVAGHVAGAAMLVVDGQAVLGSSSLVQVANVAQQVLLAVAAAGAVRRYHGTGQRWLAWLTAALLLALLSVAQRAAHLAISGAELTSGSVLTDALWLVSGLALLGAAVEGLRSHSAALAVELEVRARLDVAQQLHAGLAQDLALLSSHGHRLARRMPDQERELTLMVEAAARALTESRAAIRRLQAATDDLATESVPRVIELPNDLPRTVVEAGSSDRHDPLGARDAHGRTER